MVLVRLKWNRMEYKGILISFDNYMNLQLDKASEIVFGENSQNEIEEPIGEIFIRCNNVLFIKEVKEMEVNMEKDKKESEEHKSTFE